MTTVLRLALASATLSVALCTPASASRGAVVVPSLSVSPAITELQGRPPMALPGLVVHNTTGGTLHVHAYPVRVRQSLDGGLMPYLTSASRRLATRAFHVSPSSFTLAPGASRSVSERWLRRTPGSPGAWAAVAVDAVAAVPHPRVRVRLLQALLLTLPKAPPARPRIVELDTRPISARARNFTIRIANPSRTHGWVTHATLQLRALRGGVTLRTAAASPRVVLPRTTRDLRLEPTKRLKAGRYRALVTIRVGTRVSQRSMMVRLAAHATSART